MAARKALVGRVSQAEVRCLHDFFPFDGVGYRLTKFLVVKRRIGDVEFQIPRAGARRFGNTDPFDFPLYDLLDPFVRRPLDQIDIARLQRGEANRIVADFFHDDAIDVSFVTPVVVVSFKNDALPRLPFDELERTTRWELPRRSGFL